MFAVGPPAPDRSRALRWYAAVPEPRVRLVCFPHAGGGASFFRDWPRWLEPSVGLAGVCYPGREHRIVEPMTSHMSELADEIAEALGPLTDRPLALFGHSMGAHVAYEVAVRLEERHGFSLSRLFVSAQGFPYDPARLHWWQGEADLLDAFAELGGIAAHVRDSPELREMALELLRGDLRLLHGYRPAPHRVIGAPLVGFAGDSDPHLQANDLTSWTAATRAKCEFRTFAGGHFYLADCAADFVKEIQGSLA